MKEHELLNIWKNYDDKLDQVLSLNKKIVFDITKKRLFNTINILKRPKSILIMIGIPYTLIIFLVTFIAYQAGGLFVTLGFGSIGIIMTGVILSYFYHLYLINEINQSEEVIRVQKKITELKISSFNTTRLAIIQLPFWCICWISVDALESSPIIYGGVNLIILCIFIYVTYFIYSELSLENNHSRVSNFFLSGSEWEPIIKSSELLNELKELEQK